jgi:hypothetical protein
MLKLTLRQSLTRETGSDRNLGKIVNLLFVNSTSRPWLFCADRDGIGPRLLITSWYKYNRRIEEEEVVADGRTDGRTDGDSPKLLNVAAWQLLNQLGSEILLQFPFVLGRRKAGFDCPNIWHSPISVWQLPESLLAENLLQK